jgi:hypothetical protein
MLSKSIFNLACAALGSSIFLLTSISPSLSNPLPGSPLPSCVSVTHRAQQIVIRNRCNRAVGIRLIYQDPPPISQHPTCILLNPGETIVLRNPGKILRIVQCR